MANKCIDVSKHNGVIDWNKVKAAGIKAAIIRAGYGCTIDPKFTANIKGAQAAGLAVGVYWFAYPLNVAGAKAEADYAYKVIKPYKLDLGVFYDLEYDTERYATQNNVSYTKDLRTDVIKAFCERMKGYQYKVGLYLNPDYILYKINYNELKSYPLWLAQWKTTSTTSYGAVSANAVSKKHGDPEIWQFGAGKVNGISGNVDLNYIYCELPEKEVSAQYFAKPNYSGVSLVDALRSIGATTTFTYRKKIAAANGITVYSGTAAQNIKLLGLLKQGKLIKP